MGTINDAISQNKTLLLLQMEKLLNVLVTQSPNKSQNRHALHEIDLIKEYFYIQDSSNESIHFSENSKVLKNFVNLSKLKENFAEWTKILFNITEEDLDSEQKYKKKVEYFKKKQLNKEFFQNNLKKVLFKNENFNKLINYGIPKYIREFVWEIIIEEKYNNHKNLNYQEEKKEYISYLKNQQKNIQIEKDLTRTFLNESDTTKTNIQKLKNLLYCINKYNNGYCQGMNFIVGFLLKLTNFDEIKAFYIFKKIFPEIKGYFEDGFPLLEKNLSIFDENLKKLYPNLYNHLKKYEIYNEFWVSKWFQILFTLSLPFEELCNVWDILLIRGFDYVIYISVALIGNIEKELLKLKDSSDILEYINNTLNPKKIISMNKKIFEEEIDKKKYIICLNEIFNKASIINKMINGTDDNNNFEPKIYSDNRLPKYSKILRKGKSLNYKDTDSELTNENENSFNFKYTISTKSSSSMNYSSNNSNKSSALKNLNSSNSNISENSANKLKNGTSNLEYRLRGHNKKLTFFSSKNLNITEMLNSNNNAINLKYNPIPTMKPYGIGTNLNHFRISNNINCNTMKNLQYPTFTHTNLNYNSVIVNRPQYTTSIFNFYG